MTLKFLLWESYREFVTLEVRDFMLGEGIINGARLSLSELTHEET